MVNTNQNKDYFRKKLKIWILDYKKTNSHFIEKELFLQQYFLKVIEKVIKVNKTIAIYKNDEFEIDTNFLFFKLLKNNIKITLPIINQKSSNLEFYNIDSKKEWNLYKIYHHNKFLKTKAKKVNLDKIDLFLIPLIGLSLKQYRLGRGKGYYDRTLKFINNDKFYSLLFSKKQIVNFIHNYHDIRIKNTLFL